MEHGTSADVETGSSGVVSSHNDLVLEVPHANPQTKINRSKMQCMDVLGYNIFEDNDGCEANTNFVSCTSLVSQLGFWYSSQMEVHPIRTKSITCGILNGIGDVLAQLIEQGAKPYIDFGEFDYLRIVAMFIEGVCCTGPMLHFAFEFYEHFFPIHEHCFEECTDVSADYQQSEAYLQSEAHAEYISRKKFMNAFLHVAFDQGIMAFLYVGALMIVTGIVEGHGRELRYELKHDYFPAVKASWMASLGLAPIQIFAFRYLPVRWRVLAVNIQDIIWVVVMSYVTHRNRDNPEMMDESFYD